MPGTITDRSADAQARIDLRRQELARTYPDLWARMIADWNSPGPDDRAWLMYSANYLFRTAGVRWALDPLTLRQRLPGAPAMDSVRDLGELSFIALTHRHADHLDLELVRRLSPLPILWIVPEHLLSMVQEAGLREKYIIVPKSLKPIGMRGVRLTSFDGQHLEADPGKPGGIRGVPATGYLVEFNGKRWLFPGDTRTYDAGLLPSFGPLDGVIAHLWLGRGRALEPRPPQLKAFCTFCLDLAPKRLVVTHLEEVGRPAKEYWDERHFQAAKLWFRVNAPELPVETALMGDCLRL